MNQLKINNVVYLFKSSTFLVSHHCYFLQTSHFFWSGLLCCGEAPFLCHFNL
ncbi:hypothetical protein Pint_28265 [Pistacia integerrima]|uniref:Uncharacterized protein n=1 Tax=Pistacia integerrima TaxID=434235 RepID=A0ACC0YQH7_9ROSI|nr:hypothetical protein Pint_28265 [Pistacia integerrima]